MSAKIVAITAALMFSFSGLAWILQQEEVAPRGIAYTNKAVEASGGSEGQSIASYSARPDSKMVDEYALSSPQLGNDTGESSSSAAIDMLERFYPTEPMFEPAEDE